MNVIGFQKSASSITLHGGFNGQSLFVNGDYASYTVGGKTYDVKVEAEADSRRRLDDHHARVGGERRFLFENTEAMHEYHDEMHRIVGTFEVGVVFCCVALCLIVALLFCLSDLDQLFTNSIFSFVLFSSILTPSDVTPTDIDYQHGRRSLVAKDVGFHRRRLATVGSSNFKGML